MRHQFRDTLWFKKGQLDADQASAAASSKDDMHPAAVDLLPVEDRYLDDGSVSREDSKMFSLRTGGTQAIPKAARGSAPAPADDIAPLVKDLKGVRKELWGGVIAAGIAIALLVVTYVS